jgi:hypothetical protein
MLRAQIGASALLSGVLADPSGKPVSVQSITGRNIESGQARTTRTSAEGRYQFLDFVLLKPNVHAGRTEPIDFDHAAEAAG